MWFQIFAFKWVNVCHYPEAELQSHVTRLRVDNEVGLCTLNQVDPWPITYSLSNP